MVVQRDGSTSPPRVAHDALLLPEIFELRRKYNVPVHVSRHPALTEYVAMLLTSNDGGGGGLRLWLAQVRTEFHRTLAAP